VVFSKTQLSRPLLLPGKPIKFFYICKVQCAHSSAHRNLRTVLDDDGDYDDDNDVQFHFFEIHFSTLLIIKQV
jgi:hypothetical protein